DELVFDQRLALIELERLGHDGTKLRGVAPIRDDEVFAIDEPVGTRRISRVCQRHGKSPLAHLGFSHFLLLVLINLAGGSSRRDRFRDLPSPANARPYPTVTVLAPAPVRPCS